MSENRFKIEKFYDDLSESWDNTRPKYTPEIFRRIISHLDKNKQYSILDFGCGTGVLCRFISENFPDSRIDGIDISNQMIEKGKINCQNCNFYVGDISSTNLPCYDVIISKDVFNHIDDIYNTISILNGLLNTEGKIIIANRERNSDIKNKIINALETLNYGISTEYNSFKPAREEIDCFLKTLSGFKEEHKNIIRKKLESEDKYYIIFADKKPDIASYHRRSYGNRRQDLFRYESKR